GDEPAIFLELALDLLLAPLERRLLPGEADEVVLILLLPLDEREAFFLHLAHEGVAFGVEGAFTGDAPFGAGIELAAALRERFLLALQRVQLFLQVGKARLHLGLLPVAVDAARLVLAAALGGEESLRFDGAFLVLHLRGSAGHRLLQRGDAIAAFA